MLLLHLVTVHGRPDIIPGGLSGPCPCFAVGLSPCFAMVIAQSVVVDTSQGRRPNREANKPTPSMNRHVETGFVACEPSENAMVKRAPR